MRILFITPYYFPELQFGGPPAKIHAISRGLDRNGHEVHVVTFHSSDRNRNDTASIDGVTVHYLPWLGWGLRQWPLGCDRLQVEVDAAAVVHCYGLYNFLCPVAASRCLRVNKPYLVEPLGMFVLRARNALLKRLYHQVYTHRMARYAAAIVAASEPELDELRTLRTNGRLVLRRNGIDVESFEKLPPPDAFRERFGIRPEKRVILYMGRISPIKNLEQLVEAFAAAKLDGTLLALVGPALERDYEAKVRNAIRRLNLEQTVLMTGPLFEEGKLSALAAAGLFVLPSLSESFGNAAGEAVAARVPVLLTETCGIARSIHQRAGLAVPLGVQSLANGLRTMMDESQSRVLTERRSEVLRELSWDEPICQTEQLYADIVGRRTEGG